MGAGPARWMDGRDGDLTASNALKELWEEAGVVGQAKRLISSQDRNLHNPGHSLLTILRVLHQCDYRLKTSRPVETQAANFSPRMTLPELFEAKAPTNKSRSAMRPIRRVSVGRRDNRLILSIRTFNLFDFTRFVFNKGKQQKPKGDMRMFNEKLTAINTWTMSVDQIEAANSGHPEFIMGGSTDGLCLVGRPA